MSKSLKAKTITATAWTAFGFGASQFIRLGSNLVLTRLLAPEIFGVMTIVNIVIMGFKLVSDIGIRPNIVQRQKELDDNFLNTAWTIQIIKGILLWIAALVTAFILFVAQEYGFIKQASVYAYDLLPILIAVVATSLVFSGFNSVTLHTENRKLKMGRPAIIDLCGQIVAVLAMFIWAYFSPTIWALAAGAISTVVVKMVMSHLYLDYRRHQIHLDRNDVADIINFGKWIALSTFVTFLITQGDRLILGGFISATQLGIYSIAFLLVSSAKKVFSRIGSMVLLPAFSEVSRTRPGQLSRIYYKIRLMVDVPVYFCCGVLLVHGPALIEFLYDDRYSDAGAMLQILSISLIEVGFALAGPCLIAIGYPKFNALSNTARAIALWVVTPLAFIIYGFHTAIWVIALSFVVAVPIQLWYLHKANILVWYKEVWTLPIVLIVYLLGQF